LTITRGFTSGRRWPRAAGRVCVLRPVLAQDHRLDGEGRRPDPAGGRKEGEDLAAVVRQAGRRLQRADASLEHFLRLDGLAQEVGDADLEEPPHQRVVEGVGEHDHRGAPEGAHGDALERDQALAALGVEVDHDRRCGIDLGPLAGLLDRLRNHRDGGRIGRSRRRGDGAQEAGVGPDEHDRGGLRGCVHRSALVPALPRKLSSPAVSA
jgi:hypothetical protein